MSLFLRLSLRLSSCRHLSVCLSLCLSFCPAVCRSLSVHLSVCRLSDLSVSQSLRLLRLWPWFRVPVSSVSAVELVISWVRGLASRGWWAKDSCLGMSPLHAPVPGLAFSHHAFHPCSAACSVEPGIKLVRRSDSSKILVLDDFDGGTKSVKWDPQGEFLAAAGTYILLHGRTFIVVVISTIHCLSRRWWLVLIHLPIDMGRAMPVPTPGARALGVKGGRGDQARGTPSPQLINRGSLRRAASLCGCPPAPFRRKRTLVWFEASDRS